MTEQRVQSQIAKAAGYLSKAESVLRFTYSQDDGDNETRRQALDMVAQGTKAN